MDENNSIYNAIYIKDGKINKLGDSSEIKKLDNWKTRVIDLEGKTVYPGFIEAHCHPIATALISQLMNVGGLKYKSRDEIFNAIKEEVKNSNTDDWLLIFGWDPVLIDDLDNPTLSELDELSPNRPMLILTQMMHHGFINSAGYNAANITKDYPILSGNGKFKKDNDGELNGVVYEVSALQYVLKQLPKTPKSLIKLLLNMQYADYAKSGFTSIGVLGPVEKAGYPLEFMKELASNKNMPIRTFIYGLESQVDYSNWDVNHGNEKFKLKGVKLYMDGSPFTGGASFLDPYENSNITLNRIGLEPNHIGKPNYKLNEFQSIFEKYHKKGFQIATHVQGEVGVDIILNAIENTLEKYPRKNHRHRLEHNALITEEQINRAHKLGVTLSVFIDHIYYYGDKLDQIVGNRVNRYMPLGSALKSGDKSSVHTDNPVTPINALRPVSTAILRKPNGKEQIIAENQKISKYEALKTITINPAWQFFEEENIGTIEEGKFADLVILSNDPLKINPESYNDIDILETWLSGKKVNTSYYNWTNFKLLIASIWEMI